MLAFLDINAQPNDKNGMNESCSPFPGSFRKTYNNFRFVSTIVTSFPSVSFAGCAVLCVQSVNCSAFSFEQLSSQVSSKVTRKSTCDLAAYTEFAEQPPMFSLPGWNVYSKKIQTSCRYFRPPIHPILNQCNETFKIIKFYYHLHRRCECQV